MRILVTGSSGHLGEALVRVLRGEGSEVGGIDVLASPYTDVVGSIADRGTVRDCVASTFLRYVAATESVIDSCSQQKLRAVLESSNGDLRELMAAIAVTDAFQYRRGDAPGAQP